MNSNDFDEWNREAIISSALAYRERAEYYRRETIDLETAYNRLADERDRLRAASEEIAEQARREERERIVRWLKKWADWYRELIPAGRIVSDALDARAANLRENWLVVPAEERDE